MIPNSLWLNELQVGDLIWIVPVSSTVAALFRLPGSQCSSAVGTGRPFIQWPVDPVLQFLPQYLFPFNHQLLETLQYLWPRIFHHLIIGSDDRPFGLFFSL